ncbi:MAG: RsmB/NOP family class I SAM-dependent RNA methyltransferase [Pseudomonadota bacterium]
MTPGARLKAGAEVLDDIFSRHRPASVALSDWGRNNRYAGSGDRSAIGTLVFEALRRKHSIAAAFGDDSSRALALGAALMALGLDAAGVAKAADGSTYAIDALSEHECEALRRLQAGMRAQTAALADADVDGAGDGEAASGAEWSESSADVPHIAGDFPEWLTPNMVRAFGEDAALEGMALAQRAPVDLRVNALKATQAKVLKALSRFAAEPGPFSTLAVRIPVPMPGKRTPNVEADTAHGKGWFEVQDAGSQVAALLAGVKPRDQVLDLCAGAGGKTLAMAGNMQNTGQIYAYDRDAVQLRPIFERLKRAGVRNVQVMDAGVESQLEAVADRFDVVFVDAPCTGSGTWRRRPDAKWRLKPEGLALRQADQQAVLRAAAKMVKPGGRLVYVTCSVFVEENEDQMTWFAAEHSDFERLPIGPIWAEAIPGISTETAGVDPEAFSVLLTPRRHGTDGFFIAVARKLPPQS